MSCTWKPIVQARRFNALLRSGRDFRGRPPRGYARDRLTSYGFECRTGHVNKTWSSCLTG